MYDGELTASVVGSGGGFYGKDVEFDNVLWFNTGSALLYSGDPYYEVVERDNKLYLQGVLDPDPYMGDMVVNYGIDSFDPENLPYVIVSVTSEFGSFTFNYFCCNGFDL